MGRLPMQAHKTSRYAGVIIATLLVALLYPISQRNWFSNDLIALSYSIMFGVSIRLVLFGNIRLIKRAIWSMFLSIFAYIIVTATLYLIMTVGGSPYPEGGIVGSLLIVGFYFGLPTLLTSVGLSLLSLPIERRG